MPELNNWPGDAMQYVRMALVIIGKMILTCVFVILYVYTPELFPTVIRSTGVGCCSMVSRVGGIVASYLSLWL
uniref:Uncharacterized protein n=1 Tax=Romanomermis culicivorax TaxID=13658 RepID=A0A915IF67_ROMCU